MLKFRRLTSCSLGSQSIASIELFSGTGFAGAWKYIHIHTHLKWRVQNTSLLQCLQFWYYQGSAYCVRYYVRPLLSLKTATIKPICWRLTSCRSGSHSTVPIEFCSGTGCGGAWKKWCEVHNSNTSLLQWLQFWYQVRIPIGSSITAACAKNRFMGFWLIGQQT
jgi:hypothetical protein